MPNRVIKSRAPGGATQLADALASLIALELLAPGGRLYLISPRLGDMTVVTGPFGQFRALMPELGRSSSDLATPYQSWLPEGQRCVCSTAPATPTLTCLLRGWRRRLSVAP